jgi:hypothetical protein
MMTGRRVAECAIETMRMAGVRGFVLDRLQVAEECDGFDGGNACLCHARLAVLPLFSPGEIRAESSVRESIMHFLHAIYSDNVLSHWSIKSACELVSCLSPYTREKMSRGCLSIVQSTCLVNVSHVQRFMRKRRASVPSSRRTDVAAVRSSAVQGCYQLFVDDSSTRRSPYLD